MSPSNAADSPTRLHQRIAALRGFHERVQNVLPVRLILLIAGISSICYGQYLMEQRLPQGEPSLTAQLWNITNRLNIANYDNAYRALPYLIGGIFLCALIAMPLAWKNPFPNWALRSSSQEGAKKRSLPIVIGILSFVFLLIQLGRHKYMPIYLIFWFISIWAFTRLFWKSDKSTHRDLSLGISYLDLFWMTGLLLLGFSIASFALQDIPIGIIPDEDAFWQTAHEIATNQIHPTVFESGVFTFPIASSIFQSWVLRTFGVDLWAWRFSSVIAGVFAAIPLYLLAKEWFGRMVAIVACVLMIANPYFISFSRLGYNNSQSLFPITLSIYLFALAARKGSYFYLWLSGLVAGFGFYTYSATLIVPIILCFGTLYLLFLKDIHWKQTLITLGIILFGWSIAFLPRVAYAIGSNQQESLVYRIFVASFANVFYAQTYYGEADLVNTMPLIHIGEQHTLFYDPVIYGELLFRGTVRSFLVLFDPYIISNHFLVAGLTGVITPVFFLIGLAVSMRYGKQLRFGVSLLWFLTAMIVLSMLSAFPPAQTHLVSIIPVLALLSSIGLVAVTENFMEWLFARKAFLQALARNILITIASLVILYFGFQKYFITMPAAYHPSFETIPLWIARRIEFPVNLVYLGQPERGYRIIQLLSTATASHHFISASIANFSPESNLIDAPTIIFIESQQAIEDVPLIQKPPPGYQQPVAYYDEDGKTIGYAMTNTDIDLKPKTGINEWIRSLVEKPVRYVLLLLTTMLAIFGFLGWRPTSSYKRNLP